MGGWSGEGQESPAPPTPHQYWGPNFNTPLLPAFVRPIQPNMKLYINPSLYTHTPTGHPGHTPLQTDRQAILATYQHVILTYAPSWCSNSYPSHAPSWCSNGRPSHASSWYSNRSFYNSSSCSNRPFQNEKATAAILDSVHFRFVPLFSYSHSGARSGRSSQHTPPQFFPQVLHGGLPLDPFLATAAIMQPTSYSLGFSPFLSSSSNIVIAFTAVISGITAQILVKY